jgi:hypothetical protein
MYERPPALVCYWTLEIIHPVICTAARMLMVQRTCGPRRKQLEVYSITRDTTMLVFSFTRIIEWKDHAEKGPSPRLTRSGDWPSLGGAHPGQDKAPYTPTRLRTTKITIHTVTKFIRAPVLLRIPSSRI